MDMNTDSKIEKKIMIENHDRPRFKHFKAREYIKKKKNHT